MRVLPAAQAEAFPPSEEEIPDAQNLAHLEELGFLDAFKLAFNGLKLVEEFLDILALVLNLQC